MNKTETAKAKRDDLIRQSCSAGIESVLADTLVSAASNLLDGVQAEMLEIAYGDPTGPVRAQLLKSAGSIAANLAEGIGKAYKDDKCKFFLHARGSAYETVIWLRALGNKELLAECVNVCKMVDAAILAHLAVEE